MERASWNFISDYITNLSSRTIYYFRAVAQNQNGTFRGSIQSFQSLAGTAVYTPPSGGVTTVVVGGSAKSGVISLQITADAERVSRGDNLTFTISYTNTSKDPLSNVVLRVKLPEEYSFVDTSRGIYSERDNTVTVDIGSLAANQNGSVVVKARVTSRLVVDKVIVTTAHMVYTKPSKVQEEVVAYVTQTSERVSANVALAFLGEGFFPDTLLGWLILLIIILLLILIARNLYGSYQERRREPTQ